MKRFLLLTAMAGAVLAASAIHPTAGTGENYTLAKLATIENSGITIEDGAYVLSDTVLIDAKDTFTIDPGATLKMKKDGLLWCDGAADFKAPADKRVLITTYSTSVKPKGVYMHTTVKATDFENIDFEYAQLRNFAEAGMNITNCTFRLGNRALNSSGAVSYGKAIQVNIKDCVFESCYGPAVEGSANIASGLLIENCTFTDNNTGNYNKAQINVVTGGNYDVVIRNCTVKGMQRSKVGAVCVTNLYGLEGTNNVLIEGCDISDSRYGIYLVGNTATVGVSTVNAVIRNNKIHGCGVNGGYGLTFSSCSNSTVYGNEIFDNWVGAEFDATAIVNMGQVDNADSPGNNVFTNNKKDGVEIDLQNFTQNTIYAQNNVWGVDEQSEEAIAKVIQNTSTDKDGNPVQYGQVIYMPFKDAGVDAITVDGVKLAINGNTLVTPVENGEVLVFTLDGSLVAKLPVAGYTASLESLTTGAYIVKVGNLTAKVIR